MSLLSKEGSEAGGGCLFEAGEGGGLFNMLAKGVGAYAGEGAY